MRSKAPKNIGQNKLRLAFPKEWQREISKQASLELVGVLIHTCSPTTESALPFCHVITGYQCSSPATHTELVTSALLPQQQRYEESTGSSREPTSRRLSSNDVSSAGKLKPRWKPNLWQICLGAAYSHARHPSYTRHAITLVQSK